MRHALPLRRAGGFTIVETMVALVIIALGLLGVARMQALALSSAGISRMRSLAALEAASLASAMQANRAYWATATLTQPIAVTGASITTSDSSLSAALTQVSTNTGDYCSTGSAAPCTPASIAAKDLQEWATALNAMLPNASAVVACPPTSTPLTCTIQIDWFENAVAINKQQADTAATNVRAELQNPTYKLYVEP